jgi:hypothetical protein
LTTAAVALEEGRPTATADADVVLDAPVATLHVASLAPASSANSRLIVTTLVLVQTSWLSMLGYLAYKLVA